MAERIGLRERKKAATRAAIGQAAVRLALRDGIDRLTTDAIAAEADVAPRTFRNYFSSKEEAVVAPLLEQARGLADLFRARPADEPVWDSVRAATVVALSGPPDRIAIWRRIHGLVDTDPALLAQFLSVCDELEMAMAAAIAERTGLDPATNPYPRLQAGVVVLAVRTAIAFWIDRPDLDRPDLDRAHLDEQVNVNGLSKLVGTAIDLVRAGLPQPCGRRQLSLPPAAPERRQAPVGSPPRERGRPVR